MSQLTFEDDGFRPGSLAQARAELFAALDEGTTCKCCDQHAQRYKWTLPASAAKFLFRMYRIGSTTRYVESKAVKLRGEQAMPSICAMWGLVMQESDRRPDGGRSGWWRVTNYGEAFIQGGVIPKYAYVYNREVVGHDGPPQTMSDRLRFNFNWRDHMRGESL